MRKEEFIQSATGLIEQMESILDKQRNLVYDYLNAHPSVFLTTDIKLDEDSEMLVMDEGAGFPQTVTIEYELGNTIIPLEIIGVAKDDVGESVRLYWVNEYGEINNKPMEDMPMSNYANILYLLMNGEDWNIADVF